VRAKSLKAYEFGRPRKAREAVEERGGKKSRGHAFPYTSYGKQRKGTRIWATPKTGKRGGGKGRIRKVWDSIFKIIGQRRSLKVLRETEGRSRNSETKRRASSCCDTWGVEGRCRSGYSWRRYCSFTWEKTIGNGCRAFGPREAVTLYSYGMADEACKTGSLGTGLN